MAAAQRPAHVVVGLGGLGLTGLFLLMTGSRTSTALAIGLTLTVPLVMRFLARGPRERRFLFILGLFGAGFVALGFLAVGMTLPEILKHSVGDPTLSGRTDIWDFVLIEISHRPWLGAGYGAFWDVGLDADPVLRAPPGTFLSEVAVGYLNQAHNGFLEVMLHVGIIGLMLALVAVIQSVYQALYLCLDRTTSRHAHALHLFCFLVLVFYLGNNLMEATLFLRGQMLNNIAMLVMFLLHRIWLDRLIGQRMAQDAPGPQAA
nr:O-antigen ligase family protein [Ancylobacter gelatini]